MKKVDFKFRGSGRLHLHFLPIIVWLATLGGVVVLFTQRAQRFEVLGIAGGQSYQISATTAGILKSVPVELFQEVSTGQIVAVLDDKQLQAQLATASAEIQRLKAELAPTRDQLISEAKNLETDRTATLRRFAVDIADARLKSLELQASLETDRMLLEELKLSSKIFLTQNLDRLEQEDSAYYERKKLEAEYNTVEKRIEDNQKLLVQAQKDMKLAQARYDEFEKDQPYQPSMDNALGVIHEAIKVQEKRIEELQIQRKTLVLKSSIDGVISMIQCAVGQTVMPGVPIMTVSQSTVTEVIVYANDRQFGRIKNGMPVKLIKNSEPPQIANSQVVKLGPAIELIPQRLWRDPAIPQWGRSVVIKVHPDMRLTPGEVVGVKGL